MFSASSRGAPRAAGEEGYLVARDDENEKQETHQYRIVLAFDVSPSMFCLDETTGGVLFDALIEQAELLLTGLAEPMGAPPDIFVTVTAADRILVKGFLLQADNVEALVDELIVKLTNIEMDLAAEQRGGAGGLEGGIMEMVERAMSMLPDDDPDDMAQLIVLFVDGVASVAPPEYGGPIMQLARRNVRLHIVKVGTKEPDQPHAFGYVADASLLKFLAMAGGGSFFDPASLLAHAGVDDDGSSPSQLQKSLLWRRRSPPGGAAPVCGNIRPSLVFDVAFPYVGSAPPPATRTEIIANYDLGDFDVHPFVQARVREGFFVVDSAVPSTSPSASPANTLRLLYQPNASLTYALKLVRGRRQAGTVQSGEHDVGKQRHQAATTLSVEMRLTAPLGFSQEHRGLEAFVRCIRETDEPVAILQTPLRAARPRSLIPAHCFAMP